MGDEQQGEAEVALEIGEQVEDLRLDRDVKCGDRLVGDDQLRFQRESAGDADPLALPARELVRVAVVVLGVEADLLHQLLNPAAPSGRILEQPMDRERLGDDRADRPAGVEGGIRILEDHLDVAPGVFECLPPERSEIQPVELDRALARLQKASDQPRCRALPTARLADEPERLPRGHLE